MAKIRARMASGRRSKFGAVPTVVDGVRFASKAEAARYGVLKLLEKAGKIFRLQLQPRYRLCALLSSARLEALDGEAVPTLGEYVADFRYCTTKDCICAWGCEVEDVKGFKTPLYRWKKKHVEQQYGIVIREIR